MPMIMRPTAEKEAGMVLNFINSLFRGRISSIRHLFKGKAYSAQVKLKSKVAAKFNDAIDKPINKVKNKVNKKVADRKKKSGK